VVDLLCDAAHLRARAPLSALLAPAAVAAEDEVLERELGDRPVLVVR
jgi:hypothetical protein